MNINRFTQNSIQAVQNCEKIAADNGNQELAQEHLLYALLTQDDSLILKLFEKNHVHADVIVVDPPRKGCDAVCLDTILKMRPERVVYVSCDSATLARDLRYLADGGYVMGRGRCCDMFPGTVHVETIVLIQRKTM